ncbi:two-component system, chemotaxis family, response regulator CheY [Acetitomaculum ruminis DSM 5522]|uniref:Stage 0 sporulation protein A homolog n=1 Tax=Acetitomaculum ruminis DSM 5522 TaxID=1120918 RepID=A0A1I0WDX9_9FIRM|nr:response regulator [Acetitomaculum ruminis]SFA86617.1 two-component system, chemotaxis family, response regulator CheY [Acetitomaculum ruminis DSM 5522]
MKILIAEDDFATRKYLKKLLSNYGECDITVNGEEAVDAFIMAVEDDEPYDLVWLDVMMPVMDGFQALQAIRSIETERNIPDDKITKIIVNTALNNKAQVDKAFELGCTVYIGKPIDIKKVEEVLKKYGFSK